MIATEIQTSIRNAIVSFMSGRTEEGLRLLREICADAPTECASDFSCLTDRALEFLAREAGPSNIIGTLADDALAAREAIEEFTFDDDHELNNRDIPLLAKAFPDINGAYDIPKPFKKWLIALGCPDHAGHFKDAAKVTSSLFAGLLERARIKLSADPEHLRDIFCEVVTFAEPLAEQIRLMRQTIVEIEEELAQSDSSNE